MLRLSTPVQCEISLDAINILRPLKLIDERKIDITTPVLDVNQPDKTSPVVGKLARCDGTGSLLKSKSISYDNYEFKNVYIDINFNTMTFAFSQKVFQVYVRTLDVIGVIDTYWCNAMYSRMYFNLSSPFAGMIPFVGQQISLSSNCALYEHHILGFYGFY